ncbi:hypothetical protein [Ascidiaceihabitans sp.]|uniref:hypothetical protein n=1 Tax=Ascidiaceihabitans sp. TaxID=1872644 RepID=UPI003297B0F0
MMMNAQIIREKHPFAVCEIHENKDGSEFIGKLTYLGKENGTLYGATVEAVRSQFSTICSLFDEQGGILRLGTIMLGYHNQEFQGDVLLPDGEIIGSWCSDDEEWCHFTKDGDEESCLSAPSPWMLQDSIGDWLKLQSKES